MPSPVPPLRTRQDFHGLFSHYHTIEFPSDTIVYLSSARRALPIRTQPAPPRLEDLSFLLNGYLRSWGGMTRIYGGVRYSDEVDPVRDRMAEALAKQWPTIRELQKLEAWRDEVPWDRVGSLFDHLVSRMRGTRSQHSPVGVAKLLHLLVPGICIIWDNKQVLDRGLLTSEKSILDFGYPPSGSDYVRYVQEKVHQVNLVADAEGLSSEELVGEVVAAHAEQVQEAFPELVSGIREPLTKLLDEANYSE